MGIRRDLISAIEEIQKKTSSDAELMGIRRDLISGLKNLEDVLDLPPAKRALRTRVDRKVSNNVIYTQKQTDKA
jgi:hypothetical protein